VIRPTEDARVADAARPREAKRGTVVETGRPVPVNGKQSGCESRQPTGSEMRSKHRKADRVFIPQRGVVMGR
jgi:hypothetical protein